MRTIKGLIGWVAVTAAVSVGGCGDGSLAETPPGDQPRYKVSTTWCEKIDYEALAKRLDGWVSFPDGEKVTSTDSIYMECHEMILGLAPDELGGVLVKILAYTYNSVEQAKKTFGNLTSPGSGVPDIEAEVEQTAFGEFGESRTINVQDSNLKLEIRLQSMPDTPQVAVEVLEDFTDHVIEVVRANPGQ